MTKETIAEFMAKAIHYCRYKDELSYTFYMLESDWCQLRKRHTVTRYEHGRFIIGTGYSQLLGVFQSQSERWKLKQALTIWWDRIRAHN